MKATCKYNNGSIFEKYELPLGTSIDTQFNLVLEKDYLIMGILLFEKFLFYLTDENSNPYWYPAILFSIKDYKIASNWYFKHFHNKDNNSTEAIWGYYDLCLDEHHNDRLMEREAKDLQLYFKHKMEAEAE